ncbi:hypothetical protein BDV98DRAFT_205521 [Pterulicium gracile]|uniref:Uncharacterized protein n=1 Tax=Pterulicium gracile TaxID=1884261 RepID=A0A5C3QBA8_9AGAR|nr:hypothetical protein BDV98DRAFT_205521 [Pterula gracilis]
MVIPDFAVLGLLGIDDELLKILDEHNFSSNLWQWLHPVQAVARALVESKRPVFKLLTRPALGEEIENLLDAAKLGAVNQAKQLFRTRFRASVNAGSAEVIPVANASEYWTWTVVRPWCPR